MPDTTRKAAPGSMSHDDEIPARADQNSGRVVMLGFSADLATSFSHLPMLDRIDAAAAAGFRAVEACDPYEVPADEMARRLKDNGLAFAMLALPNTDSASRITAGPDGAAAFRSRLAPAIAYSTSI